MTKVGIKMMIGGVVVAIVIGLLPGVAYADFVPDTGTEALQLYDVSVRKVPIPPPPNGDDAGATSTQTYKATVRVGEWVVQTFNLTAYNPAIAVSVDEPAVMEFPAWGETKTAPVPILVFSGGANGYEVYYQFSGADMVCESDGELRLPTIAVEGPIGTNTWGHNVAYDGDGDGVLDVPATWKPGGAEPFSVASVDGPSALPYDRHGMMVGAQVDISMPACTYTNTLTVTAVEKP